MIVLRAARPRALACTLAFAVSASVASEARAEGPISQDEKAVCLAANEKGQILRLQRKLRAALAQFRRCAAPTCPAAVREDCADVGSNVEAELPSLLVTAKDGSGHDVLDAALIVDDEKIANRLAEVTPIDPGKHIVRILLPDGRVAEETVIVVLSEKAKAVAMTLPPPTGATPSSEPLPGTDAPGRRPVPKVFYPVAGVGVAGLASFGVFATWGQVTLSPLEKCKPGCSPSQVDVVYTRFTVADVSLAIGVAALGAAAILWLTRPTERSSTPAALLQLVGGRGVQF